MVRIKQRKESDSVVFVSQAVADFLASAEVKRIGLNTQREYTYTLHIFASWCDSHALSRDTRTSSWIVIKPREKHECVMLHRVDNQVVFHFLEHLKVTHKPSKQTATKLSDSTLALYVKNIKRFLNWCLLDEQYSCHVQYATIQRIQKPKIEEKIPSIFSDEDILALRKAAKKEESLHLQMRDEAILLVLFDTGIRATELVSMTIGNVSLKPGDPHIRIYGKGSKWREVGMGEETRRAVQKYLREFREPTVESDTQKRWNRLPPREQQQTKRHLIGEARLFVNRSGYALTKSGLGQLLARLGTWAELENVRCSPHTARYTFAINFMENNNYDIYRLSKILGHTSVKVTELYLRAHLQIWARKGVKFASDRK